MPIQQRIVFFIVFLVTLEPTAAYSQEQVLGLYSKPPKQITNGHLELLSQHTRPPKYKQVQIQALIKILSAHTPDANSVKNKGYITDLAAYYGQFPETYQLLTEIKDAPWQLHFGAKGLTTKVTIQRFKPTSMQVKFNPFKGAQLKFYIQCAQKTAFCVASPADTLIHEFIHIRSIYTDTQKFIADGGLNQFVYPIKHEISTIKIENNIYRRMSEIDGKPRPLRQDHVGKAISASCITCIQ